MTHIICRAMNCLFWEGGICSAEEIEYEPDAGCITFQDVGDAELDDESEEIDWESEDDLFEDEDEDDDWESDDDDWEDDGF